MDIEHVKEIYENVVKAAQRTVAEDGDIFSHSIILAYHGKLDAVHAIGGALMPADVQDAFCICPSDDVAMLIRPWPFEWADILNVLSNAVPEGSMRDGIGAMLALAGARRSHARRMMPGECSAGDFSDCSSH